MPKNIDNVEAKSDVIKDVTRRVRNMLSAQRKYDKGTVDSMREFANLLMNKGLIGSMSIPEVKTLTRIIANSTGVKDVHKNAVKLSDFILKHQLKECESMFKQLLKKGQTKINASGVEIQGHVDSKTATAIKQMQEAIKLTEEGFAERSEDIRDRMGRMIVLLRKKHVMNTLECSWPKTISRTIAVR